MQTSSVVKRRIGYGAAAVAGVFAVAGATVGMWAIRNLKAHVLAQRRTRAAGFRENSVDVNGTRLNYASGPKSSGPPLLLIHGQESTGAATPPFCRLSSTISVSSLLMSMGMEIPREPRRSILQRPSDMTSPPSLSQ